MRTYWYYTCGTGSALWSKVCYSDSGEFDLAWRLEVLNRTCSYATIVNWHEISKAQYEKLCKLFDNPTK